MKKVKNLKRVVVMCFAAALLTFVSCASAPVKMELDSFQGDKDVAALQLSEFDILGRVIGLGTIVYTPRSGKITGDTHKYGFIDQGVDPDLGSIIKLSRFKKGYALYGNPVELARANAVAQMIEQAQAMDADRIVYVTYSVTREASRGLRQETVSVTARGVGIKLLAEIPEPVVEEPEPPEPPAPPELPPAPPISLILEGDIDQEKVNEALVQVYDTHRSRLDISGAEEYIIRSGDTLSAIIRNKYGDITDVGDAGIRNGFYFPLIMMASAQDIVDPDFIEPGMVLVLPDLRKNLDNPDARQAIKETLLDVAYIYNRKGDITTENGLKTLADSL